jgi:hypothetical protein
MARIPSLLKYGHEVSYDKDRKYRNVPPRIILDDINRTISVNLDKEIRILRLQTAMDTHVNRKWCYWAESTCQTFVNLLASSITGSGVRFRTDNKKALDIINNFNIQVNYSGSSIEDLIHHAFIDNAIDGISVWRILKTPEPPYIDLGRLDSGKVFVEQQQQKGFVKFIYEDYFDPAPKTKREFYSPRYSPPYDPLTKERSDTGKMLKWHIPSESTLFFNLVSRPSMSAAMQYVIFKRWILWFMRKTAEKNWFPPMIGTLGNKEKQFQYSPEDEEIQMRAYAQKIAQLPSFGVLVKRYGEELEILQDRTSAATKENFINSIRLLDEQTIFAMGGTLGFTGVEKSEIGESRQKENMLIRAVESHRRRIGNKLVNFYVKDLLPEHDINMEFKDIIPDWSHLKQDRNLEIIQMTSAAWDSGMLHPKYALKALSTVWDWIDVNDPEQIKWMKDKFEMLNKQKEPGFGQSQAGRTIQKATQATRPVRQKSGATQKR